MKLYTLTLFILFFFVYGVEIEAQKQNNIWYFGENAGLDFNTSPPTAISGEMVAIEGCASIADPGGKLLFYTNGINVWDRNHNIMPNGHNLIGGLTSTEAAIIVPLPNSNSKYFIFTTKDVSNTDGGLHYSIVDLELNGGLGDVMIATKNTHVVNQTAEKVTSVLHANGTDIWIITHTLNNNDYLSYLLTSTGLNTTPVVSSTGSFYPSDIFGGVGHLKPAHNGSKLVSTETFHEILEISDFNTSTGNISNTVDLNQLFSEPRSVYGIEFSPNDSLLYISSAFSVRLYQINLSTLQVIELVSFTNTIEAHSTLQLGPNHKIYMSRRIGDFLDVINFPDLNGTACQYEESGVILNKDTKPFWGLPAFVPYSFYLDSNDVYSLGDDTSLCLGESLVLKTEFPSNCDSTNYLWSTGSTDSVIVATQSGIYWVSINSSCGSFVDTIEVNFIPCLPIVQYDLEACVSNMNDGTNMDYSEFSAVYPNQLQCADITASVVYRAPPQENKHSCTPGIDNNVAMCISAFGSCSYSAGNNASLVVEVTINPEQDSIIWLTGLGFYEKAPINYNWINGPSGPNNYPRRYGLRILKNGNEIFVLANAKTEQAWNLESYDFTNNEKFKITENTVFRLEWLPYCPIGNGAEVSAWDIDEISIFGGCVTSLQEKPIIDGFVLNRHNQGMPNISVELSTDPLFTEKQVTRTNGDGYYFFNDIELGNSYYVRGYKNDDLLNGVSLLDLVSIQKHLLGITPFTSLEQFVAADANRSNSINVLDLVTLQKLLLGKYTQFPGNTSWRFGLWPQDFTLLDLSLFQEVKFIESLQGDVHGVNFLGIKIGDVNGDARNHRD